MGTVRNGPGEVTLGAVDRAAAVAAVKVQLRIGMADDDMLIAAYAESALGLAEQFTGRATIVREMVAQVTPGAAWQALPAVPVRAVTGASAGDPAAALPAGAYAIDIDAQGRGWVRVPAAQGAVSVTFSAGLAADWAGLPAALRLGVVLLAAHLFDDRGGRAVPPAAVAALWRPYRDLRLQMAAHA